MTNRRERVAWALAGTAIVAAVVLALQLTAPQVTSSTVVSFDIEAADGHRLIATNGAPRFAVSPDGTTVVYQVANIGKGSQLWLRRLGSPTSQPIPNTEAGEDGDGTQQPFWSPDGRYVGFFDGAAQKLKKIDLQSGLDPAGGRGQRQRASVLAGWPAGRLPSGNGGRRIHPRDAHFWRHRR